MPPLRHGAQGPGGYAPGGGAAGELGVDVHAMVTAAGYVEHVSSVMRGEVDLLLTNLSGLVGKSWNSPAAVAFQNAQDRWVDAHRALQRALDEIAGGLRDSSTMYDQADEDSRDGIAKAVAALPYH